jgi:hypothetical protein
MSNAANHMFIALYEEFKHRSLFRRVPHGCCICLADDGDLILTGKATHLSKEDITDLSFVMMMGVGDNITHEDTLQQCTGNFIRG